MKAPQAPASKTSSRHLLHKPHPLWPWSLGSRQWLVPPILSLQPLWENAWRPSVGKGPAQLPGMKGRKPFLPGMSSRAQPVLLRAGALRESPATLSCFEGAVPWAGRPAWAGQAAWHYRGSISFPQHGWGAGQGVTMGTSPVLWSPISAASLQLSPLQPQPGSCCYQTFKGGFYANTKKRPGPFLFFFFFFFFAISSPKMRRQHHTVFRLGCLATGMLSNQRGPAITPPRVSPWCRGEAGTLPRSLPPCAQKGYQELRPPCSREAGSSPRAGLAAACQLFLALGMPWASRGGGGGGGFAREGQVGDGGLAAPASTFCWCFQA